MKYFYAIVYLLLDLEYYQIHRDRHELHLVEFIILSKRVLGRVGISQIVKLEPLISQKKLNLRKSEISASHLSVINGSLSFFLISQSLCKKKKNTNILSSTTVSSVRSSVWLSTRPYSSIDAGLSRNRVQVVLNIFRFIPPLSTRIQHFINLSSKF